MTIKTCPHCNSDRVFRNELTMWRNINDSTDMIDIEPRGDEYECFDCLEMTAGDVPVEKENN